MIATEFSKQKRSSLYLITWLVLLSATLVFSGYGAYTYHWQRDQLEQQIIGQTMESAERLSRNLASYIDAYQVNEYDKLVSHEMRTHNHSALSAIMVDDYKMGEITGQEVYSSGWHKVDDALVAIDVDSDLMESLQREMFYYTSRDILGLNGEKIGVVRVYANDAELRKRSDNLLAQIIVSMLVLLLVLSLVLILLLRHIFIRPLKLLSDAVSDQRQYARPREFGPDSPYQEISLLTDAIRQMLQTIDSTQHELQREHQYLENIVEGTRAGTWYWNVQTGQTRYNERWASMLGYQLQELEPISIETWRKMVHPEDLKRSEEQLQRHFDDEIDFYECDVRMRHKEGHWIWVLDRGRVASRSYDGQPLEMFGTHLEITEAKQKTEQLELAASIYRQAREGIMVLSDKGIIVDVNEAFSRITGYTKEEAIGKPPTLLNSGDQSDEFYREVWSNMQQQGYWSGEVWNRRKNGERYPELLSVSRVCTGQHSTHFVALSSDITEIKEYEEQLRHIAHFDVLTGLPNRVLLFDRLGMALEQTKREQKGLAVFFIDLDGFKEVNDTYGHDAGDFLLTELSRRLSSVLRSGDTLARLGGDEFVAVLPGVQGKDQLTPILMRMLQEMNRPVIMSGEIGLTVTASIGISLFSGEGDSGVNQLVTEADQAMYQAKLKGKNSFCFAAKTDTV